MFSTFCRQWNSFHATFVARGKKVAVVDGLVRYADGWDQWGYLDGDQPHVALH